MAKQQRTRTVYRLPPCHSCDVEKTESWLQDMAREGLFLKKEGIGWGLIRFERGEPRNMQYRLFSGWQEPTLRTIWKNRNILPSREEQDFHASYGWYYVAQRGLFYIYAREEEDGREMHTDPAVQAIDVRAVSKWIQWTECFFAVVTVLVLGVLFLLMAGIGDIFFFLAEAFGFLVCSALLLAVGFVCTVRTLLHLRRLRQKLQAGECLDHHKPWRKGALGYRVRSVLFVVVLALYFLLSMVYRSDILGDDPIQNGIYPGDLPFPTVAELIDDGEFTPDPWERTMYSEGGTVFYPVKLHVWEEGELVLPDGKTQMVYLRVLYYETRTPAIAEIIVRDMLRMEQSYEYLSFEDCRPWNWMWSTPFFIALEIGGQTSLSAAETKSCSPVFTRRAGRTSPWRPGPPAWRNPSNPKTKNLRRGEHG